MKLQHRMIVFDAADLHAESAFWAGLLGGTVQQASDRWHNIWVEGEWQLGVQHAPEHVAPQWPGGTPQQMHLDFYLSDPAELDSTHESIIEMGGSLLRSAPDRTADHGVQTYSDPAGHPFCICWLPPH